MLTNKESNSNPTTHQATNFRLLFGRKKIGFETTPPRHQNQTTHWDGYQGLGFSIVYVVHELPKKKQEKECKHQKEYRQTFLLSKNNLLELIDELILLVTHLKYYDGPNCDLIKI